MFTLNVRLYKEENMRGRKKGENSKTKVLSIRITEDQHELLCNNDWMRKEISKHINEYLSAFIS